ncbi:MAG: hypothetical protein LBB81_07275 [Treponema sp.]|jgi:hypothetical protein|nr:hypothetical protein [Treponema sp.]
MMNLDLRASLIYEKSGEFQANFNENEEYLICYKLDLTQAGSIEPQRELLLEKEVYIGKKTYDRAGQGKETVELATGLYLFTQLSEFLNQEEWLDLAIEQQKDGLWERNSLKNELFIRYLYEDGRIVTQLFRPIM